MAFLCPLTECGPAEGRECQGRVLANTGEDAAVGEPDGCEGPGGIAGEGRPRPIGPLPLQLGSGKPPRPGAEQGHSCRGRQHSTGGLPRRGIWEGGV